MYCPPESTAAAALVLAVNLLLPACGEQVRVDCSQYDRWSCIYETTECNWIYASPVNGLSTDTCLRRCDEGASECDDDQSCEEHQYDTGGETVVGVTPVCIDE